MSFWSDIAPVLGGVGGFLLGGPVGALAGASVGGAISSSAGVKDTNAANKQMAQDQMGFQANMSNTSYQRAVEDMEKAGINPALAYSQGGASTPGGSSAQAMNEAFQPDLSGAIMNAASIKDTAAGIQQKEASTDKIRSDTELNAGLKTIQKAQVRNMDAENRITSAQASKAEAEAKFYNSEFGRNYAIPLRETLGLAGSALGAAKNAGSVINMLKGKEVGSGTLSDDEKSILKSYNKGQGYKRRQP